MKKKADGSEEREKKISTVLKLRQTAADPGGNPHERENAAKLAKQLQNMYNIEEDELKFAEDETGLTLAQQEKLMNGMLAASAGFLVLSIISFIRASR